MLQIPCGCKWDQMSQQCYFRKWLLHPKINFPYKWIFEQLFLQIVIIDAYNCPSTWHFFVYSFWINIIFLKCADSL